MISMGAMNTIDLRRIDLNLLVVFQALMQEGSVTRAAVRLSLTQSAVSAALGRLRVLFDDPLFERSRTGMVPTWRALEISSGLGPALSSIAGVIFAEPEFEPTVSTKVFHLAMSDDLEIVLAPWLALQKIELGWTVDFAFHQTNSTLWRESVEDERTDVVLTMPPKQLPADFHSETLFSAGYLCLYNPDLVSFSDPMTYEEYIGADHVRVSYDVQRGWVDDLLAARGHQRKTACAISHFAGLSSLLRQLPAVATFPEYAAKELGRVTGFAVQPTPLQAPKYTISALWGSRVDGSPENAWLRKLLSEFSHVVSSA